MFSDFSRKNAVKEIKSLEDRLSKLENLNLIIEKSSGAEDGNSLQTQFYEEKIRNLKEEILSNLVSNCLIAGFYQKAAKYAEDAEMLGSVIAWNNYAIFFQDCLFLGNLFLSSESSDINALDECLRGFMNVAKFDSCEGYYRIGKIFQHFECEDKAIEYFTKAVNSNGALLYSSLAKQELDKIFNENSEENAFNNLSRTKNDKRQNQKQYHEEIYVNVNYQPEQELNNELKKINAKDAVKKIKKRICDLLCNETSNIVADNGELLLIKRDESSFEKTRELSQLYSSLVSFCLDAEYYADAVKYANVAMRYGNNIGFKVWMNYASHFERLFDEGITYILNHNLFTMAEAIRGYENAEKFDFAISRFCLAKFYEKIGLTDKAIENYISIIRNKNAVMNRTILEKAKFKLEYLLR